MARRSLEEWFWQVGGDVLVITSSPNATSAGRRFWEPKVDLFEDQSSFVVKVELAGVNPQELQIVYLPDRHSVLLRGVRRDDHPTGASQRHVHQLEIYYGEFEREVNLPDAPVEPDKMLAHYRGGFLYVLVPKASLRVRHTRVTIHEV